MLPIQEGAIKLDQLVGEIGQLLTGKIPGRANDHQITVYNSLGITSQDLYAARHVMGKALEQGTGTRVSF